MQSEGDANISEKKRYGFNIHQISNLHPESKIEGCVGLLERVKMTINLVL